MSDTGYVVRMESSASNGTVIRDERDIRIASLERELAEAKRSDVAQAIRASKAEAEVERAREDGFMNGFSGAWYSDGKYDEQYAAAWSRYQQEREGER